MRLDGKETAPHRRSRDLLGRSWDCVAVLLPCCPALNNRTRLSEMLLSLTLLVTRLQTAMDFEALTASDTSFPDRSASTSCYSDSLEFHKGDQLGTRSPRAEANLENDMSESTRATGELHAAAFVDGFSICNRLEHEALGKDVVFIDKETRKEAGDIDFVVVLKQSMRLKDLFRHTSYRTPQPDLLLSAGTKVFFEITSADGQQVNHSGKKQPVTKLVKKALFYTALANDRLEPKEATVKGLALTQNDVVIFAYNGMDHIPIEQHIQALDTPFTFIPCWIRRDDVASWKDRVISWNERAMRKEAEEAREKAEIARLKADDDRVKAEEDKRRADDARAKAEEARLRSNDARIKAEQDRVRAEEGRRQVEAELERDRSELKRLRRLLEQSQSSN